MHAWVKQVQDLLPTLANEKNAKFMTAYLRDQYSFYGIQSGPRREILKPLFSASSLPHVDEVPLVVDQLMALPEREYQLVAIDLLIKLKKKLPATMLVDLERWITTKSWWDTVDMLATHIAGTFFQQYPHETADFIKRWRHSDNIWLRRTTLLYQLKYKQNTDVDLLRAIIEENLDDKEFFIQKAIGWVLREYSKTDPEWVVSYIEQQQIQGLARREGLKWLNNRKPQ
jgi:3-methyladenine DNA glycosylase AlkD